MFKIFGLGCRGGSTYFIPPAFGDMPALFVFGQLLDFVSRIAKHAVEDAATSVLAVSVTLVGQPDHAIGQQNGLFQIVVAWFH
jgi:hypothetical protein